MCVFDCMFELKMYARFNVEMIALRMHVCVCISVRTMCACCKRSIVEVSSFGERHFTQSMSSICAMKVRFRGALFPYAFVVICVSCWIQQ